MKSTITTRPLIDLVEEYLLADASERAKQAKSVWETIHMPGAPEGVASETAYNEMISAELELNKLAHLRKTARELTESRRLHHDAGLADVTVFESEESLRKAVEASCEFEVMVDHNQLAESVQFVRNVRGKYERQQVPLKLTSLERFICLPEKLHWLTSSANLRAGFCDNGFAMSIDGISFRMRFQERRADVRNWREERSTLLACPGARKLPEASFVIETRKFYSESPASFTLATNEPRQVSKEHRDPYTGYVMGFYSAKGNHLSFQEDYDASSLFTPYSELIRADLDLIKGEGVIDPEAEALPPLLHKLIVSIKAKTGHNPFLDAETNRYSTQEVYELIGAYWDRMINSPWNSETTKDFARLKNLCAKSNDGVNVWGESSKGLFGFKVRTREHDWISGWIFCPPHAFSPKNPAALPPAVWNGRHYERYLSSTSFHGGDRFSTECLGEVVSVGPCLFLIGHEKDH
jgi:hypothetical protein